MPSREVAKHVHAGTNPWSERGMTFEPVPQFHPVHRAFFYTHNGKRKPHSARWSFSCDWLDDDGRCSNYEKRPDVCRSFEAKSDPLCVEFGGSWRGELKLYAEDPKT
jgi:Fe-S-cluster containining protein